MGGATSTALSIAAPPIASGTGRYGVRPGTMIGCIIGLLIVDELLLWYFLGLATPSVVAVAVAGLIVCAHLLRRRASATGVLLPWSLVGVCFAISTTVYVLGGEGRLFYANTDWQVRGAVLRDLVNYPWPFVYADPQPMILRLPLGMYLLPASVGKLFGFNAAELALLLQNSALLTGVLTLGAMLFANTRSRLIAVGVFLGFSGMDIIGALLTGHPIYGHLERWSIYQYSSHITQAFWVPQHALAGWIGALFYLLWRDGKGSPVLLISVVPLLALLSPLALIGLLPFAAHAAFGLIARRAVHVRDLLLPLLAILVSLPSLAYLTAAADTVGGHIDAPPLFKYLIFECLEVAPFLIGIRLAARGDRFGTATFLIMTRVLLIAPLGRVGESVDLVMRASIPALAILSVLVADRLAAPAIEITGRAGRQMILIALVIGLATPATEIGRALFDPRSPAPLCSYPGVVPGGAATYVATLSRLPRWIKPAAPTLVHPRDPKQCWDGPWPDPVT